MNPYADYLRIRGVPHLFVGLDREGSMVRRATDVGPKLEALLDERDHLRIQISMSDDDHSHEVAMMRRRLLQVDHDIIKGWMTPKA